MPEHPFSNESLVRSTVRIWRENNVSWLVGVSLMVTLLACLVGYLDLIPTISTNARPPAASFFTAGHTLTVTIEECPSDQGQVVVMLYDGASFNENSNALRIGMVKIKDGEAEWSVHNLPYGQYSIVAFHDLNSDESFDPAEERRGFSLGKVVEQDRLVPPASFPLADTIFVFSADNTAINVTLRP